LNKYKYTCISETKQPHKEFSTKDNRNNHCKVLCYLRIQSVKDFMDYQNQEFKCQLIQFQ